MPTQKPIWIATGKEVDTPPEGTTLTKDEAKELFGKHIEWFCSIQKNGEYKEITTVTEAEKKAHFKMELERLTTVQKEFQRLEQEFQREIGQSPCEIEQEEKLAARSLHELLDQDIGVADQRIQGLQYATGTAIDVKHLVASLDNFPVVNGELKMAPFRHTYDTGAGYISWPSDPTKQRDVLFGFFKSNVKTAYLIGGNKINMKVMFLWIPEGFWTAVFTEEETKALVKKEEENIQRNIYQQLTILRREMTAAKAYPPVPNDVEALAMDATAQQKRVRGECFKLAFDRHNDQAYGWIELAMENFVEDVPVGAIIRKHDPQCAFRNKLIAVLCDWLMTYHEQLLKDFYLEAKDAHEEDCARVFNAGFENSVHPKGLTEIGELLDEIEFYF